MPSQATPPSGLFFRQVFRWLSCVFFLAGIASTGAQGLPEAQEQFRRGNYEAVIRTAREKVAAENPPREDWRILLVQGLLTTGRYGEAYTNALTALEGFPSSLELRLLAREAAFFQNDPAGADRQLMQIKFFLERRSRSAQGSDELVVLGRALLLLGVEPRLVLENCFQRAEKTSPPPREAFLASGQLALDKHDFALAADAFRAGLKQFPEDPDLHSGLARAFQTGDRAEMMKDIQSALAVNPRHVPTLLLLADHLIDAEQYDDADEQLAVVLKVNPSQPEALSYRAVLACLRNDSAQEEQFRAEALKHWTNNPEVDFLIGRKLSQKYRFEEGAAAQCRALEFDPDYLPARRQLAEDWLRLGQDDAGWKLARQVHTDDAYDVTAYNLVTLQDQMAKFQTLTNADFIVHMAPLEAQLYGDRLLQLLTRARQTLTAKYGVELSRPTVVEIFPTQKDFAVRTFGMPGNPGYLGVCFGSVITANSPASQAPDPANWEDVLWHEFCHVVTLNATRNRMPRWFSEGISVYEERQADPAWGERMDLAYREMILNGELTPLGKLSSAFLAPKDSEHLQFAYYESSLVVEFLAQQFGFDTVKKILGDLHDGVSMNESIAARTVPLPELERQFARFVREQADQLAPGADLENPPGTRSAIQSSTGDQQPKPGPAAPNPTNSLLTAGLLNSGLSAWEKAHPDNYYLRMEQARELMSERKWAAAETRLESVARTYSGERRAENPLWLLAVSQRNLLDTNAEWATLQKFARQESDFVDLYIRLIELSEARTNWTAMADYSRQLLAINPLIALPYRAQAQASVATGNQTEAITSYRKLLLLDPADPAAVHYQLARLLHARGDAESEAKRQVLESLEEAPRFRDAQRLLLDIEDTAAKKAAGKTPEKDS
jgi:tetratricopeptide (TPR) repeat protein